MLIIVIYVTQFQGLQDDSMPVIRKNNKAEHGIFRMSVAYCQCTSFRQNGKTRPSAGVRFFCHNAIHVLYTIEEYSDRVFVYDCCNGKQMMQEQNTKEGIEIDNVLVVLLVECFAASFNIA